MSNTLFFFKRSLPNSLRERRFYLSEFDEKYHAHIQTTFDNKQVSVAREEKLFSVHVVLSQIHKKKDDFATSNSTKHLMCEPINKVKFENN